MKKTTPALLLALAALALPAGATPLTQTQTATAGFAQVQVGLEIVVDKANGLSEAIDMVDAEMKKGQIKEATITIDTCEPQKLPGGIHAAGKITIVGCGDTAAGVGGDNDAERTVLTPSSSFEGMLVQSPLEIRGVKLDGFPNQAFNVQDELTITNSVFIGKPSLGSRPRVASVDIPSAKSSQKVVIKDSYISGAELVEVRGGSGDVTIMNNKILHNPEMSTRATIELSSSSHYPTNSKHPARIEANEFESTGALDGTGFIRVGRPDVTVHNNTFTMKTPKPMAAAIQLFSDKVSPLKDVSITYNVVMGGLGASNNSGDPIVRDAVKVNRNDFSKTTGAFPKGSQHGFPNTVTPDGVIDATLNFWGTIDTSTVQALTDPVLGKFEPFMPPQPPVPPVVPGPQPSPSVSPSPSPSVSPSPAGPRVVARVSGETRVETAVQVAESEYKDGAKVVILARSDVAADSVSAVPLAEELDAPILLTQSDSLHPATGAALKKLLPSGGRVILMGGEVALSAKVANDVTGLGGSVERIAGPNRAGTAVETANQLMKADKLKQLLVADGTDWQADLIAGPAAAEVDGGTLLTNGDAMAPETAAFLGAHTNVKVTAIGANAAKASGVASKVEGADATALSLAVAKQFFTEPKAVGVATDAEFADSLAGGAQVAKHDGPMILVPASVPGTVPAYLKATPSVTNVYVYGGPTRIPESQLGVLAE